MRHDEGSVEVICGSMFCGKTEELIRRLKRAVIARQKVQVFKPVLRRMRVQPLMWFRLPALQIFFSHWKRIQP